MFGLFSERFSAAGVNNPSASGASPDAAALKSMQAKKQLAAQARATFMDSNVTLGKAKCRSVWSIEPPGKIPPSPTAEMAVIHRRKQVCAFPYGEVRQCLLPWLTPKH